MKTILREQRLSSVMAALVTLALGCVLVFWPDRSIEFLCMLLGVSILCMGGFYFLGWLARRREGVPAFFVLPAVVLGALGAWLMSSPASVIRLIQYIFGTILIFHGLVDVQGAVALIAQRRKRWWLDLLLSALTIALGALVLLNPFEAFSTLVVIIGLALIFDGLSDLYLVFRLSRGVKTPEEGAEEVTLPETPGGEEPEA